MLQFECFCSSARTGTQPFSRIPLSMEEVGRKLHLSSGFRRTWVRLGERGGRDPPAAEARAGRKSFLPEKQLREELKEPVLMANPMFSDPVTPRREQCRERLLGYGLSDFDGEQGSKFIN